MWRKSVSEAGGLGETAKAKAIEEAGTEVLTSSAVSGRIVARVSPENAGSQLLLNMATLLRLAPSCLYLVI